MPRLIAATMLAFSALVAPISVVSTPSLAQTCGVDAPEGWERPGGFCDALAGTSSLSLPVEGAPPSPLVDCKPLAWIDGLKFGERIHVAGASDCPLDEDLN